MIDVTRGKPQYPPNIYPIQTQYHCQICIYPSQNLMKVNLLALRTVMMADTLLFMLLPQKRTYSTGLYSARLSHPTLEFTRVLLSMHGSDEVVFEHD